MIRTTATLALLLTFSGAGQAAAHCQIPCGIYDDEARARAIAEHITTIEKSMRLIREISAAEDGDTNQLVRWTNNKDQHADELVEIVTYYFLSQRLKPQDKDDKSKKDKYATELSLLHEMMVVAMKAKQTTDPAHVVRLRSLLTSFEESYFGQRVSGEG
jgi:nickel superoxide dismutase